MVCSDLSRIGLISVLLVGTICAQALGQTSGRERSIVFFQSFDHGSLAVAGGGWACEQPLEADALVPGRFGNAYRMERARTNLLSANQASFEQGTDGIIAPETVQVRSERMTTDFGERVLRAQAQRNGELWRLEPVEAKVSGRLRATKVFVFSAYLKADNPGVRVRLSLADENEDSGWQAPIEAKNAETLAENPEAKVNPPVETEATSAEAELGTDWQRVTALLEIDSRREEQTLVAVVELLDGAPAIVDADGMQLEQAAVYPLSNTDPTTWIPGGTSRGPSWLDLPLEFTGHDNRSGTLSLWVRPLPDQGGGIRSVAAIAFIGTGWFNSAWQIGGSSWYGGGSITGGKGRMGAGNTERALFEEGIADGWHHLALTWDQYEMVGYHNGAPFGKAEIEPGLAAHGSVIRLGGSLLESTAMTGDLDEVVLFDGRMSDEEVAELAARQTSFADELPGVLLRRPIRTVFLRSEQAATITLEPVPFGTRPAPTTVEARIPAMRTSINETIPAGRSVNLTIQPWLTTPGRFPLNIRATAGTAELVFRSMLDVFEEPPNPDFIIYSWGMDEDIRHLGFNCGMASSRGGHRTLLEWGMWATTRIDVRDAVPHPWSPQTRAKAEPIARQVARTAMAHPNIMNCLVNSEVGNPPFPDEQWFLDWMKQETGLDGIPDLIDRSPIRIPAREGYEPPAVLPDNYPPLLFCNWWRERGQGYWLLNNQIVDWMKEAGYKGKYYSDQPEALTQFANMDIVDYWTYPVTTEGLVARLSRSANMARLVDKPFQAMPGTVFWDDGNGIWVIDDDGERKVLSLSADQFRAHLWIAAACPSSGVGLYGFGERRKGAHHPEIDQTMIDTYAQIAPIGTLVGGLPLEQAKVALLETEGLLFVQPGAGDDWIRHWLMRAASRTLARARLYYDWITDDHVHAGWLDRYDTVVVPGAWCLPESTYRHLVAFARGGGQVVADNVLRADIPGVHKLAIDSQAYAGDEVENELGGWAREYREKTTSFAHVTPVDRVFSYTREDRDARYIFVVNDHREIGPWQEKWDISLISGAKGGPREPMRDKGLPQEVTISVPQGFTLYDVLAHQPITAAANGDRQTFSMTLAPGAAAVIAALPEAITTLAMQAPAAMAQGAAIALNIQVQDAARRPVQGRQLVELTVTAPDGSTWSGVQRYHRVPDGRLTVPLRLPLRAQLGQWTVEAMEWISGLRTTAQITVQ